MSYLNIKHNSRLVIDTSYPWIDMSEFKSNYNLSPFYGGGQEAKPMDSPYPLGKDITLRMFFDSDHAEDKSDRRSRTGFMVFVNMEMINWHTRKQAHVECAVFGAKFVAMKQGVEALRGIRFKLQMMGVKIDVPTYVYGDNMSVIHNTSNPELVFKNKSNSICYHFVREAVVMKTFLSTHVPTAINWADLLWKVLFGKKRRELVQGVLFDIYDY